MPSLRNVSEGALKPHRGCDVGQRVAAEGNERVRVSDVLPFQDGREDLPHTHCSRPGRFGAAGSPAVPTVLDAGRQGQDGGIILLSIAKAGNGLHRTELDAGARHAQILCKGLAEQGKVVAVFDGGDNKAVGTRRGCGQSQVRKEPLHLAEVDAEADDFYETASPANDLVEAVGAAAGQIARVEFGGFPSQGKVFRPFRVAEHHIRSGVDQLAVIQSGDGLESERAAGHGHADCLWMLCRLVRRQIRHARRGLGLPVHNKQVPALPPAQF